MLRRIVSTLALTSSMALLPFSSHADQLPEGDYKCKGYDPFTDSHYENTLLTVEKKGAFFHLTWKESDGGEYSGKGLLAEDEDVLSSVFWQTKTPDKHKAHYDYAGLQVYEFNDEATRLEGHWLIGDQKLVGHETCVKHGRDEVYEKFEDED